MKHLELRADTKAPEQTRMSFERGSPQRASSSSWVMPIPDCCAL